MKGTLALSWGPSGGFYVTRGRVCLGVVALTLLPNVEIEDLMEGYLDSRRGTERSGVLSTEEPARGVRREQDQ